MSRAEALRRVQRYDFALKDTELFLDTHPTNEAALAFYGETLEARRKAAAAYEAQYGPLTAAHTDTHQGWAWAVTPWPWEMED